MSMNSPGAKRTERTKSRSQGRLKYITLLLAVMIGLPISSLAGGNVASAQSVAAFVITAPAKVEVGQPIEFSFRMASGANIAAYEAVMLFDPNAAEFQYAQQRNVGLRGAGRDVGPLSTIGTAYGLAIGSYTCPFADCVEQRGPRRANGASGSVTLGTVAIVPTIPGLLEVNVDSIKIVDAKGMPVTAVVPKRSFVISVGDSRTRSNAPAAPWNLATARRNTSGPFDINGNGQVDHADAAEIGMEWTLLREHGQACGESVNPALDVNHDGCIDVADLQLVAANYGPVSANASSTTTFQSNSYLTAALSSDITSVDAASFQASSTFVVNSTGDESDAVKNDDLCLTSVGTCTLRAAIQQSNQRNGPDRIEFNIPGGGVQTINITDDLPTLWNGNLTIDGYTQPGSSPNTNTANRGSNAVLMIQLIGGGESKYPGLKITSSGNVIRGLALSKFNRPIWLYRDGASNNIIVGNFIGTNAAGTYGASQRASTQSHGVHGELGASNNRIGGTDPADRNVISGNGRHGVGLWHGDTLNNQVINNVIGLKPMGDGAIGNQIEGVDMNFGASNTEVRGNVSSGNGLAGIDLSHGNTTTGNLVIDNYIGTDVTGTRSFAYTSNNYGLRIKDGVRNNTVTQNVIGTNIEAAIDIQDDYTTRNTISNNLIGITPDGSAAGSPIGVRIHGSSNTIGPNNVIANHTGQGVQVGIATADFNTITRNSIYSNGGLGIDLNPTGVNPNDTGDGDGGANQQLNFPELTNATTQAVSGTACADCVVEIFIADSGSGQHGEGKTFVGSGTASASGDFTVALSGVAAANYLTATATDSTGNTSEFSLNLQAIQGAGPPAAPTALAASAASDTQIDLSWTDNATDETAYTVQRSLNQTDWTVVTDTLPADSTTYADTGLDPETTYYYQVLATNAAGSSTPSNIDSDTTDPPPVTIPAQPTDLAATTVSDDQIDLTWSDNADNETAYVVERSLNQTDWTVVTDTLPADSASYSDTGLDPSTTYHYRVKATNGAGSSTPSDIASDTTDPPPVTIPASPTDLTATAANEDQIDLAWSDNADDETAYVVERSLNQADWTVVTDTLPADSTTYADTGLEPSTTYFYRVRASNSAGSSTPSNVDSDTTDPPPPTIPAQPTDLTATAASDDQIDLAWTDNATDETAYTVERSLNQTDWTIVTDTLPADSISYADTGLDPETLYHYRVKATNSAGDSGYSNTDSATTDPPPVTIPDAPSGLTAATVSDDQIDVSWTDNADDEMAYTVEQSLDQNDWTVVTDTLPADSTSYSDTGLDPNTTYFYRVKATNSAGDSGYSNIDSATTNGSGGGGVPLPGRIEAEDYKAGGESFGYHDTTPGNNGGAYRTDDVDIEITADSSGAFNVGWIEPGEWLAYDIDVASTGSYRFIVRLASPANNKNFHLEVDGVNVTGSRTIPNTGGFQNWVDVVVNNIQLTAGAHELRFVAETNRFNLNYLIVEKESTGGVSVPGRIEVEDYKIGGEGVGYHDTTPGNNGGAYRTDNVDIQTTADSSGTFNVGWIDAGEWLAYDIDVASTGSYRITVRAATPNNGKSFHIEVDGANVTGSVSIPNTGGFQNWTDVVINNIQLTAGTHELRLVIETDQFNLNYFVVEVMP